MSIHEVHVEGLNQIDKDAEVIASEVRRNLCEYEGGIKDSFDGYFPLNGCSFDEVRERGEANDVAHLKFLEIIDAHSFTDSSVKYHGNRTLYRAISSYKVTLEDGSIVDAPFMAHYSSSPVEPILPNTELMEELEQRANVLAQHEKASTTCDTVLESLRKLTEQARLVGEQTIKGLLNKGYNAVEIDEILCSGDIANHTGITSTD